MSFIRKPFGEMRPQRSRRVRGSGGWRCVGRCSDLVKPPEGEIDEEFAGALGELGRVGTRHRDDRVVGALPLHLCLVVCDGSKVPKADDDCQGNKRPIMSTSFRTQGYASGGRSGPAAARRWLGPTIRPRRRRADCPCPTPGPRSARPAPPSRPARTGSDRRP